MYETFKDVLSGSYFNYSQVANGKYPYLPYEWNGSGIQYFDLPTESSASFTPTVSGTGKLDISDVEEFENAEILMSNDISIIDGSGNIFQPKNYGLTVDVTFKSQTNFEGKISEEENTRYYIEEYYKQVLSKLDPERVYRKLDNSTLLCYEDPDDFCHRHVVAAWFNLLLGNTIQPVCEIAWIDGKHR